MCKDIKITRGLKERFCKDMNLPIKIFESPYFESRISLFDPYFGCKQTYHDFIELVNFYGSEAAYFEAYSKLKDDAILYLNENPEMLYFSQKEDMNKYTCKNQGFPSLDIFKEPFDGKTFCSIDMKKGNFTAVHYYNPSIVGNKVTYEDFLSMFTDKSYFLKSKYIRQVIFGNVSPKRQVTLEKYMMDLVLTRLLESGFEKEDIVFFSTDEIVICFDRFSSELQVTMTDIINTTIKGACEEGINVRADVFTLHKLRGTKGYVKKFRQGSKSIEFKCLDFLEYPFVARAYNGEVPTEEDFVFLYEGYLVKLLDKVEVEVV